MPDIKDQKENLENRPEKNIPLSQQEGRFEDLKTPEAQREREDEIVAAKLRKEIDLLEADEKTKAEAEKKAQKIEFLGEKEKIEHLLQIAREKGLVFAIQVAKKTNDPFLLDVLHDTLAQEGYFKDFSK